MKGGSRWVFLDHDVRHMVFMVDREKGKEHYSIAKYQALNSYIRTQLDQVEDPHLKSAIELLQFHLFHEDEGGYLYEPANINENRIFQEKEKTIHGFTAHHPALLESDAKENGEGLRVVLRECIEGGAQRISAFAYPENYQTQEVQDRLPQAEGWLFRLLTGFRTNRRNHFLAGV